MKLEWDFQELYDFADRLESMSSFENRMKQATKDVAKALLKRMKGLTPVDEYDLINGWDGNQFLVTEHENGYEVLIVNKSPYALYVNDGHRVRNRKNGQYYQVKRRIQVRSPHKWQKDTSDWYVFGHFFVERGIQQLTGTKEIESIIYAQLQKWWEECING